MIFWRAPTILWISTIASAFPPPEPCTGWCQGKVHDPSVIFHNDQYFRFATRNNLSIATAPSLNGPWKHTSAVLPYGSKITIPHDNYWAPDVLKMNSTFYLTYSVSHLGSHNSLIGIATSPSLLPGSWTDHGSIDIPHAPGYNRIDSNLYQTTPESPPYLSYGSFGYCLAQMRMANPPLKVSAEATSLPLARNTTHRPHLPVGPTEGAFQFRWPAGDGKVWHYLFFSSGGCCNRPPHLAPPGEEYKIMVCRSRVVTGGFVDREGRSCLGENGGSLVLGSHGEVFAPGGQGVRFDEVLGAPVVYYHYVNRSVGFEKDQFFFGWNRLDFGDGWPVVIPLEGREGGGLTEAPRVTRGSLGVGLAEDGVLTAGEIETASSPALRNAARYDRVAAQNLLMGLARVVWWL